MRKYKVTVLYGDNSMTYEIHGVLHINDKSYTFTDGGMGGIIIAAFPVKKTIIMEESKK